MPTQTFSSTVIRPDDLLLLRLDFLDVNLTPPQGGQPAQVSGGSGARLIVHFQPQHVAEEAFWEASEGTKQTDEENKAGQPAPPAGNDPLPPPGNVQSRLAGPTRLAFTIPPGRSFPLTLQGVLDAIKELPLSVPAVAGYEPALGCLLPLPWLRLLGQPPPPKITQPNRFQTAIEAPYRLFLSPDGQATWRHAAAPVAHDGRTELWHTRLGTHRPNGDPRVRAVWSPDFSNSLQTHALVPFRMSLDGRDRNELVHLTSDYYLPKFTPTPVETERLMLTTLGAWLDLEGRWTPPSLPGGGSLTVEQWRHVATMGRDHFVRVVYAGYLFPFGHRASLVKITERKFYYHHRRGRPSGFVAYDFQRMFILVREPERSYSRRDMPLRKVTFKTRVTPNLAKPEESEVLPGVNQEAFWPRVAAGGGVVDFPFHLVGVDWEGRQVEFNTPLIFVSKNIDEKGGGGGIDGVISNYKGIPATDARRARPLGGQPVAFAPSLKSGDTTLEAADISFVGEKVAKGTPHFRPAMAQANVNIPAVKQLLGTNTPSTIELEPTYANETGQTFGNKASIFARVTNTPELKFAADKTGGLVAPDIAISGLSRSLGPVGGPVDQMVGGSFKPADIFGEVKLLGGIKLSDIIKVLTFNNAASTGGKLPQFRTLRDGDVVRTEYIWSLTKDQLLESNLFKPNPDATFELEAVVEKRLDVTTPPNFKTTGSITSFSVVLLPEPDALKLVSIDFKSVRFVAEKDKKLDTAVELGGIQFLGILEFVNRLKDFIPMDGFNDPPSLELVPPPDAGVNVGFSLGIPTIGIGVLTIQNIVLAAGFYLPFVDKPTNFRFAFCKREQPFILTVSLFGGGGFFVINLGLDGVKSLEAALEFGASVALNLGVAKGQASIMAGFYYQQDETSFEFTGYFRAAGSLSVLGIITVSLEFYLGLSYVSKGALPHAGKLWGQAKLTVKIEILFFSTSVSIKMEREFAGSDPTFQQLMAPTDWALYCDAFADYPAVGG